MKIVRAMFGSKARFEDYAAVTELFFCGKADAKRLNISQSRCAGKYFERVYLKVRPRIVFCVWPPVLSYFQIIAGAGKRSSFLLTLSGHTVLVVEMPL